MTTPMTPSTNPARDEAVQPITPERLAEVKERFNAIPHADPDSLTGHVKGMLALIDSLSAAPAPASGGVDAVYEACAAVARGDVRPQADGFWTDYAVGRLDAEKDIRTLASLSPAATSGSEAGGDLTRMIASLPDGFVDDGNCCAGKLAKPSSPAGYVTITTNGTTRTIPADEPVFLIRGQDAVGGDAVRAWADLAERAGCSPDIVLIARMQAAKMDEWPKKKVADLPKQEG